jgi:hypothetical protein
MLTAASKWRAHNLCDQPPSSLPLLLNVLHDPFLCRATANITVLGTRCECDFFIHIHSKWELDVHLSFLSTHMSACPRRLCASLLFCVFTGLAKVFHNKRKWKGGPLSLGVHLPPPPPHPLPIVPKTTPCPFTLLLSTIRSLPTQHFVGSTRLFAHNSISTATVRHLPMLHQRWDNPYFPSLLHLQTASSSR